MILDAIIGVVVWIINTSLTGLATVIPSDLWEILGHFGDAMATVVTAGPVGTLAVLFLAHSVINVGLNAFVFGLNMYRLIPLKFT